MTTTCDALLGKLAGLLAEAAEWRLLGLLFACPRGDWHEQLIALAAEVRDDRLQQAARTAAEEGQEDVYHTTFGPGGPAAPREVSHRPSALSGQYLAELLAFYKAFAYNPPRDEPPDHVAAEIDFVAYLRLKQAYAHVCGDEANAALTAEAAGRFINDHLATLAAPLAQNLQASGIHYLSLAAQSLLRRVGPHDAEPAAPTRKTESATYHALPICDSDDCCGDVFD
jgi:nitrate reductase assembly molybdenum cofactor insertion protein NarJ